MKLNWFWRGIVFFGTKSNQDIWSTSHLARAGQQPWRKNAKFCGFYVAKCIFICMGRTGEWVFKLLKKCIKALITYQGHAGNQELCRRIGTCALRKHNSCKIRVCSEGNMMQGRSSATYLFYDQVHIMGYPIEPSPLTILGKESNNKNGNLRWISPWFSSWMNEWFFLKTI